MASGHRVHKRLLGEELEGRVVPADIFFLHQSCGEGIMADHGSNPGLVSQLETLGHNWGDYSLWNSPPGGSVPTQIASLFADSNGDGVYGDAFQTVAALNGARDADILMLKSCFYVLSDLEDPGALTAWETSFATYVAAYANQNPDQKIVVMPAVPLRSESGLSAAAAARARDWGEWLAGTFITDYCTHGNVFSFNLFDFWADAESHPTNANYLKRAYCRSGSDEHPNDAGYTAAANAIASYLRTTVIPAVVTPPTGPEVAVFDGATAIADGQATPISFGSVREGDAAPTHSFTVRNDGTEDLTLGAISLPDGYTLVEGLSGTLAPGASDTFTVRLDTDLAGVKSGQISFATNDSNENPFNFAIVGTVTSTALDLTVSLDGFGAPAPAQPGDEVWVVAIQTNSSADAVGPFTMDIYLSLNTTAGDGDDVFLGRIAEAGLGGSATRYRDGSFAIPDAAPSGSYYLYVVIDAAGEVSESNETNNVAWSGSAAVQFTHGRVLRPRDTRMTFTDSDGDTVQVIYTGPGYAILTDASGGRPDLSGSDIASVEIHGSTLASKLSIRDMTTAGGNTLTLGALTTEAGASLGGITVTNRGGQLRNTTVTVGDALGAFSLQGLADHLTMTVGGTVRQAQLLGGTTNTTLTVGGLTTLLKVQGGQANSVFALNGGANQVQLTGGMSATGVTVAGAVTNLTITGAMADASSVHVTGTTGTFRVTEGIRGASTVDLDGAAGQVVLNALAGQDSVASGSRVTLGADLTKSLTMKGRLAGTVDITGSAAGRTISVNGGLSGSLLAGVFGNVTVTGSFSGTIGDAGTVAGTRNTLRVTVPGGGGTVTPANAFAKYFGYTV